MRLVAFHPLALAADPLRGSRDRSHVSGPSEELDGAGFVLSRQLPRLAATILTASGRVEGRFFPMVGREGGRTGFVAFEDCPDPAVVGTLGGPLASPELVVDGRIADGTLTVRIVHAGGGFALLERGVPLDPEHPARAAAAWIREIAAFLDLEPTAPDWEMLSAEAFFAWLHAEDDLLAREANLEVRALGASLSGLARCLAANPWFRSGWRTMLSLCGALVDAGAAEATETLRALGDLARFLPDDPMLMDEVAALLERGGLVHSAKDLWRRLSAHRPDDPALALRLSAALADEGKLEEGLGVLEGALALAPQDPVLLAQSALLALRLEPAGDGGRSRLDRFIDALASVEDPPLPAVRVLGALLVDRGDPERARAVIAKALERHPSDATLQLHLGRALAWLGRRGEATRVFEPLAGGTDPQIATEAEKYLRLSRHPGAIQGIERVERALAGGALREALEGARDLVRSARDLPEAWHLLGMARSRLGHRRRAATALRRALALAPALHEARNELGIALVGLGRFREGYELLRTAVGEIQGQAGPMAHMAQACYYLKLFEEGEEWLRRAEAIAPAHPTIRSVRSTFYPLRRL